MRLLTAIVLAAIIVALCVYAGFHHPGVTLDECLSNPVEYDGTVIYSPHESTVGEVLDDGFILQWEGKTIPVFGVSRNLKSGYYVQIKAVFHKGGYLKALAIRAGGYRRLKMAVSVIGFAIVLYLLIKGLRWDSKLFALKTKASSNS